MYCLKCGRETEGEQVFCNSCLETMGKYPIKPGTHIQLPKKEVVVTQKKTARRRPLKPEEQIAQLRKSLRRTRFVAVLLVFILAGAGALAWFQLQKAPEQGKQEAPIGQNFTVEPTTTVPPTEDVSRETIPSLTKAPNT